MDTCGQTHQHQHQKQETVYHIITDKSIFLL
jgi:hypothetical protein